jgi:hypothetical protein
MRVKLSLYIRSAFMSKPSTIKCLTLHQPYGDYIKLGLKKYETRSFSVSYKGLVAIHAGKTWDDELQDTAKAIHRQFPAIPLIDNPTLGAVLCICRLLGCHRTESLRQSVSAHERAVGGWADGRWAWELEVLEVFDAPIPAKGQQGLFDWTLPEDFLEKRIAIVGSRNYPDLDAVKRYVYSLPKDVTIISGGARGVDSMAVDTAKERGMKTVVVPVNQRGLPEDGLERTRLFAQRAMFRNSEIVQLAGTVVGFWDMESRGTKDSLDKAEKAGKTVLINPNVVAPEAKPQQMKLDLKLGTYDEGALIDHSKLDSGLSEKKAKETPFAWSAPWLVGDNVWVWDGWKDEKRHYKLVPKDSDAARLQASFLKGFFYGSNTRALREWLDEQLGEVPTPGYVADVADMSASYMLRNGASVETLPLEKLVLTQDTYLVKHWRRYYENFSATDKDGNLAYGMRFSDSDTVYIADGTHRVLAARSLHYSALQLEVNSFPETFAQACGLVSMEDDGEDRLEFIADVLAQALSIIQEASLVSA